MSVPPIAVDRAAAIRRALVRLVARKGFHGTSMAAVAQEAGVATGTAYVHYASKDELVFATYLEVKHGLGTAAIAHLDVTATARERFAQLWLGAQEHLSRDPDRARFLVQVDASPYASAAHERALTTSSDPFMASGAVIELLDTFVGLPMTVLFDLAFGPVIRLTAAEHAIDEAVIPALIEACWRAVTTDDAMNP